MSSTINSVVAGSFYPADRKVLEKMLADFFKLASKYAALPTPKAIIAPHAGYIYSGPIAASAYACLKNVAGKIKQVVILAPSHRYYFTGIAATGADIYETPLGQIQIDKATSEKLVASFPQVSFVENAFSTEHSLEVHLPFLQTVLSDFKLLPLIVGQTSVIEIAEVIENLWDDEKTLIIVSSDLSHYHDYETAKKLDSITANAICRLDENKITGENACGYLPIRGLLAVAKKENLQVKIVDLRNSGDTSGEKDAVVGYGAFHLNYHEK